MRLPRWLITLLAIAADDGRPVPSRIHLEKLLFLIEKELKEIEKKINFKTYNFIPYKYGPFSDGVYDDIEFLKSKGLIEEGEGGVFYITKRGKSVAKKAIEKGFVDKKIKQKIDILKKFVLAKDIDSLLFYIYTRFPEYAIKSEIKERILRRGEVKKYLGIAGPPSENEYDALHDEELPHEEKS